MHWLNGWTGRVDTQVSLAPMTWFRLGGAARWVLSPSNVDELCDLMRRAKEAGVSCKVLGAGANVLVGDAGFDGAVIRLDGPSFTETRFDGSSVHVRAGVNLLDLTHQCARRGLSGLEGVAGIPGTVGGAVRMNAGGRFGQFGDVVETVSLVDTSGSREEVDAADLGFAYRHCALQGRWVTGAVLRLEPGDPAETSRRFQECWRIKKSTQPLGDKSAGCVFKNPPGRFAGALIDQAGLKGSRVGAARVSQRHANFIVTGPGTTSAEVLSLIDHVRTTVDKCHGVALELEIDVW